MENLDSLGKYAPYFAAGSSLPTEDLAKKFAQDLREKIDALRETILKQGTPTETRTKNTLRSSIKNIQINGKPFFKEGGQCKGACVWFAALFLEFKKKNPEIPTETILSALSNEFDNGVGIQAAFLQHEKRVSDLKTLLKGVNLKLGEETKFDLSRHTIDLKLDYGPERFEPILKKLHEASDGVYMLIFDGSNREVEIIGHGVLIIKEEGQYYPFDPNALFERNICESNSHQSALYLCRAYSPYMQAMPRFAEGYDQIPTLINPEDVEEFRLYIKAFQDQDKNRAFIYGSHLLSIFLEFQKQGKIYPKETRLQIYYNLCILPSAYQMSLEYDYHITLQKLESVQS